MNPYVLTCSSTADLTAAHFAAIGVPYVCYHFYLGEKEYPDDLGASIPFPEFYRRIASGEQTRTSTVNIAEFAAFFRPFLEEGKDLIHVSFSSGLSGGYAAACSAAAILKEQYPERNIYVVDSLGASSGYGMLVDAMAKKRDEGLSAEELRDWAEENKLRVHHWFMSTDLSFYIRGGRISKAAGTVASALGICPLLHMDALGRLVPVDKVHTKKKTMKGIVRRMLENADGGADYSGKCYISQSDCLADAQAVAALVEETFPKLDGRVEINWVGTTIGSHTGPGTVAMYFWGDKR